MLFKAAACGMFLVLSLTACATVDLSGGEKSAGPVLTPAEQRLRAEGEAFEQLAEARGWVAGDDDTSRAGQIADMLLHGVTGGDDAAETPYTAYLAGARDSGAPLKSYIAADLVRAREAMTKVNAAARAVAASPARGEGMTSNLTRVERLGQTSLSIVSFFETVAEQGAETTPGLQAFLQKDIRTLDAEANRMIGFADALAERRRAAIGSVTS